MAVDISHNPIIATPTTLTTVLTNRNIKVVGVRVAGGASGDAISITNSAGTTLLSFAFTGVNQTAESTQEFWVHGGLGLIVVGAGTMYVYLEE